jgi:glutamine amidotransferase
MNLVILDLNIGNLNSVVNSLKVVGYNAQIVHAPDEITNADVIVLPGVGAFKTAMDTIHQRGLFESLRRHALVDKKPLLGICLGMQLLADSSDENGQEFGLALIPGRVVKLDGSKDGLRVPNIGWHQVQAEHESTVFPEAFDGDSFYHVHSYHYLVEDQNMIAATFKFGDNKIVSAVENENISGIQFHPEKSHDSGLDLIASIMNNYEQLK